VIIGMPCSGKSTIGRMAAQHFNMDFYDLDTEIVNYAGMSIEEIFREKGEAEFRRIETLVTGMMARKDNAVIATGGGIVTRPENMALLKIEGTLVMYIHRDFYRIATTPRFIRDKRPVLKDANFDKLFALYKARLPLYKKYADLEVRNEKDRDDSFRKVVAALEEVLYGTGVKPETEPAEAPAAETEPQAEKAPVQSEAVCAEDTESCAAAGIETTPEVQEKPKDTFVRPVRQPQKSMITRAPDAIKVSDYPGMKAERRVDSVNPEAEGKQGS